MRQVESWMGLSSQEQADFEAKSLIGADIKAALDKLVATHGQEQVKGPLLLVLSEFFRERIAPVDRYCEAFRQWHRALIARGGYKDPTVMAIEVVLGGLSKSSMLDRLIYGGEKLRTEKCPDPKHAGVWQGLDDMSHICLHGCGNTGWLPQPDDDAHAYGRWFMERFKKLPIFTEADALGVAVYCFKDGNPGPEGVEELESLGLFVSRYANGLHNYGGVRLQVRSIYYRNSETSLAMLMDHFIPTALMPFPKTVRTISPPQKQE